MAKQQEPYTVWFSHEDGRGVEVLLQGDAPPLYRLSREDPGGVYIGSDPACDVVLEDDAVEGFQAVYYALGHHLFFELITGYMPGSEHAEALYPGDTTRGDFSFAGWSLGPPERLRVDGGGPSVRAARAIAEDARLEGRAADAAAILAQVGLARREAPRRTALPAPLAHSERVLRIRVASMWEPGGPTEVWALGSIERLAQGVILGDSPDCDVVVRGAGENRIRLVQKPERGGADYGYTDLWVEVLAGAAEVNGRRGGVADEPLQLRWRWSRVQLGHAFVQLCRWPGRTEQLR